VVVPVADPLPDAPPAVRTQSWRSYPAYHLLRVLGSRHEVHVVSLLHDDDERRHLDDVRAVAASVQGAPVPKLRNRIAAAAALAGSRSPDSRPAFPVRRFSAAIRRTVASAPPDVVLAYCTGIAPAIFRAPLETVPAFLDMVDLDSEKWAELAETSSFSNELGLPSRGPDAADLRADGHRASPRDGGRQRAGTVARRGTAWQTGSGQCPTASMSGSGPGPTAKSTRPEVVFCAYSTTSRTSREQSGWRLKSGRW
jgi:hypothetical protein